MLENNEQRGGGGGGRGGGEAVSSGSTWLWSSLDQGPVLDMNMERSSPCAAQSMTLLQDRLTDNAFTVSALCFECPFKTGRCMRVEEKESGLPSFCLHTDRSKTGSCLVFTPFQCQPPPPLSVTICLLPSSSRNYQCTPCRNETASISVCPSIPKPFHSMLLSVASLEGLLFTKGGREVESWREKRRSRKEP
ncbi:hypothetical protein PAMP_017183 [Pampus punctatissimus]